MTKPVKTQKPRKEPPERTQADIAREALELRRKAEARAAGRPRPDVEDASPREGMRPETYEDQAPSGALDHGGRLPAMQRSRFAR